MPLQDNPGQSPTTPEKIALTRKSPDMTTNKNQSKNNLARRRIRPGAFKEIAVCVTCIVGMTAASFFLTGSGAAVLMAFMTTSVMLGLIMLNGFVLFTPRRVEKPATCTDGPSGRDSVG